MSSSKMLRRGVFPLLAAALFLVGLFPNRAASHPLGNFTINHFSRLRIESGQVAMTYVIDMAEIPAFQELRSADTNGDGTTSDAELQAYMNRVGKSYADGLVLSIDGSREPLKVEAAKVSVPPGAGGLSTLRLEYELAGASINGEPAVSHRLQFEDTNQRDRIGWREVVVAPGANVTVFNSSAFSNSVSNDLRVYPADMLASPLNERRADLSWVIGPAPAGAVLLRTRSGRPTVATRDRFAELINVRKLTPGLVLLGLLVATVLGAAHALSPGHGKTVVGAYLVGSRGTPRHAAFLGLTVTITHTAGVFALGLLTLFASRYILPERLFPILSLLSGALVALIGFSLFAKRLGAVWGVEHGAHVHHGHTQGHGEHDHVHVHAREGHVHTHEAHVHTHEGHEHAHEVHVQARDEHILLQGRHVHSHGGRPHSHLPLDAKGDPISWRGLLALGISGGLLPCPSALVVLLSAIALHRVGYGLLLVLAFSVGLAGTLTGVGLTFVYAGRWLSRFGSLPATGSLARALPVVSAFVVGCLGAAICYEAVRQMGIDPLALV